MADEIPEHPVYGYTHLARGLCRLLDAGGSCSIEFARRQVIEGALFEWLRAEDDGLAALDLSVYPDTDRAAITERFLAIDNATLPNDLGANKNGLAMLLAWCIEGIQMMRPH
jgi:hypothetical protein